MNAKKTFKKLHHLYRAIMFFEKTDTDNYRVYAALQEWESLCNQLGNDWSVYKQAVSEAVAAVRNPQPMASAAKVAKLKAELRAAKETDFFAAI